MAFKNFEKIVEMLKSDLNEERFSHSLSVADLAKDLAKKYGESEDNAYLAGLLHDCGKCLPIEKQRDLARQGGAPEEFWQHNKVLHQFAGAVVAWEKYGVSHQDILGAISYHTTGRAGMTKLEKIIFVADLIEPLREEDNTEVFEAAFEDLDRAVLMTLDGCLISLIKRGLEINRLSFEARNYYVNKTKGKD